jgi:integrase
MADVLSWFEVVDQAGRAPALSTAARLMLWLGLRESEVITARWEWFDWERATYTPGLTKGREADALRVLPQLAGYLAPLRATEGLVACRADGTPYGPGFMRDVIRVANAACKIKGITPHRLRGTIATWLSESGTPAQDVQAFLRHKDIRTTMAYLEKNMDRVSAAQEKIAEKAGLTWRENGEQL